MTEGTEHPLVTVLRELGVRRHAAIGLAAGGLLTVAMYAYRVLELGGPAPEVGGSPGLFVLLAFVLAVSTGTLITAVLTFGTAIRRVRE